MRLRREGVLRAEIVCIGKGVYKLCIMRELRKRAGTHQWSIDLRGYLYDYVNGLIALQSE
jgi:hypothetical protein